MTKINFQISLQKSNSNSLRKDRLVVRRTQYDPKLKRSKALGMVFSCKDYEMPSELPSDTIQAHNVTDEEHEKYKTFISDLRQKEHSERVGVNLRVCTSTVNSAVKSLSERSDGVTLSEIEKAEAAIKELKKQLARHKKNAKKREEVEEEQQDIFDNEEE